MAIDGEPLLEEGAEGNQHWGFEPGRRHVLNGHGPPWGDDGARGSRSRSGRWPEATCVGDER
jgi:hypothetical protein